MAGLLATPQAPFVCAEANAREAFDDGGGVSTGELCYLVELSKENRKDVGTRHNRTRYLTRRL